MSLLTTIFGPGNPRPPQFPDPATCPHTRLMPRYRNNVALQARRPMGYKCQRCYAEFLPNTPLVMRWLFAQAAAHAPEAAASAPTSE
jgi:hypothetical protein